MIVVTPRFTRLAKGCRQLRWQCLCTHVSAEPDSHIDRLPSAPRIIPLSKEVRQQVFRTKPHQVQDPHLLKVAVIGIPNTGKSTLINNLMQWKVCSVSKKVHTTRKCSRAVMVDGSTQVVFMDTPGLVTTKESSKHQLEQSFVRDPEKALVGADLIAVLHDVSNHWTRDALDAKVLRLLHLYPYKTSALILNKIDQLKSKRRLLGLTHVLTEGIVGGHKSSQEVSPNYIPCKKRLFKKMEENQEDDENETDVVEPDKLTEKQVVKLVSEKKGWHGFQDVFMISALTGDGVDALRAYFNNSARPAAWMFNPSVVTDQDPLDIALQTVRAKLLEYLPDEIPYIVQPEVEFWDVSSDGRLRAVIQLKCPRPGLVKILIGPSGKMIQRLSSESENDLRNIFRQEVFLRLVVLPPEDKK